MEKSLSDSKFQKKDNFRVMPNNELAEQMLLGAMLTNNDHYTKVSDFLFADHFFVPIHKKIYEAIGTFIERGVVATSVTLKNYFENDDSIVGMGGAEYLTTIASYGTSIINVYDYSKTIVDLGLKRSLINLGEDVVKQRQGKRWTYTLLGLFLTATAVGFAIGQVNA
jgi:replicative DNA helicase